MEKLDSKTLLVGMGNDFKILIDDVIGTILTLHEDMELLKVKTSKPDKHAAALLLDYLGWEEDEPKKNLEKLCGEEIRQCMKWLDFYCEKEGTTKEQALKSIIDGEI